MLLLSRFALDCQPHEAWVRVSPWESRDATWEESDLRNWLNASFYQMAFDEEEKARIDTVFNMNSDEENMTRDKVFCLNEDEAQKYMTTDEARLCTPTSYAMAHGCWHNGYYNLIARCRWWLRTVDQSYVDENGMLDYISIGPAGSVEKCDHIALRPALWIYTDPELQRGTESSEPMVMVSEDQAFDGVYNYCRQRFDWSIADEYPDIMYVIRGEETEEEYQIIFRSYTGSFTYFYVNKISGEARMVNYVPVLDIYEDEEDTINIFDYLDRH